MERVEPDAHGPLAPPRRNGELVFEAPWETRAFGLAGWWFLQHRSPLTPTTAAGARSVGVRKSNCTAGTGFTATCTYNANDPNEILLLDAFENPFCNNP